MPEGVIVKPIELVDLVDTNGVIQKQRVPRSESDSYPGLYLQIVIAVVFDTNGRVLVHKRAQTKKIDPGDIDHICGGVMSGETPETAAYREAQEETGVKPLHLKVVRQGLNTYDRYRYLLVGQSDEKPGKADPREVEWIRFIHPNELREKLSSGEFTFVDEFFEDTQRAMNALLAVSTNPPPLEAKT